MSKPSVLKRPLTKCSIIL